MAELVLKADLAPLSVADSLDMTVSTYLPSQDRGLVYLPAENAFPPNERIAPWHLLHHPGYWLRLSARSAKRRLRLAYSIPDEDWQPPSGTSPVSTRGSKSTTYDTYLAPEPAQEAPGVENGFNHSADIVRRIEVASAQFQDRKQRRFVERLQLDLGREFFRKQDFEKSIQIVRQLWEDCSWRAEKWWLPLFELNALLHGCAEQTGDLQALVLADFELHHPQLRLKSPNSPELKLDLMKCGSTMPPHEKEDITLLPDNVASFRKCAPVS